MRVAILSPLFERVPPKFYGGTERVVANLCRGLSSAGIEVVLFASRDSVIEGQDVQIVPVVEEAIRLRKDLVVDPNVYNFKMLAMVAERAHEFDVIHNHHDYWMLPLSKMTQVPLLSTLHGRLDIEDFRSVFLIYNSSSYVSISDSQQSYIPNLNWVRTIHHGIDVNQFKFNDKPGNYLAFLGRISPEKRPEWAIEVALRSSVPLKIAAKIEGPESQQYYDTYIKPHVDGKWIEYVGEISEGEKSEFLGNALAMVFPIDWPEPFGLVMLESLACGTPVLARPCGSVPELLVDGVTGYSHSSLKVLSDRVKNLHLVDRTQCRTWVEKNFSLQKMTEDYIHVYRHVAAKGFASNRHRWDLIHPVERASDGNTQDQF